MMVDTLTIARELKAADLPPEQAEAIAAAIGRSVQETAATKADLSQAELRLEAKIDQLHVKLLVWFIGTQVAVGALIVALVKL